jgi:hypothetical protein
MRNGICDLIVASDTAYFLAAFKKNQGGAGRRPSFVTITYR